MNERTRIGNAIRAVLSRIDQMPHPVPAIAAAPAIAAVWLLVAATGGFLTAAGAVARVSQHTKEGGSMWSNVKQYVVGGLAGGLIAAVAFGVAHAQHVHPLGGWPLNVAFAAVIATCATRMYVWRSRERHYSARLDEREARGVEYDLWSSLRDEEAEVAARIYRDRRRPRAGSQ